ncbi:CPBP family intramembrane glutamic endopeptidase [Aneurinibacillus uraniidurans]|uniref:CPBP family intramembrane glutamic endopeptidase n=1 Tax=Aneurinibacillus uraniidurans TaxID=2966586 RepID=UPI00234BF049|nr:type II CAAX endopeptidase family protein [Aneurinibacillus sp. B1]WCN36758.1 type II CAAX endopeptidase family protein [Aneurinibacillus sp. B1]
MDVRKMGLTSRVLALNVYITQGILLLCGLAGLYWFYIRPGKSWYETFAPADWWSVVLYGTLAALFVIVVEVGLTLALSREMFDDGGVNELLFRDLSSIQIICLCFVVAVSEELLFRAVIQPEFGIWWTSILFTVVHVRYWKKWVMVAVVCGISLLFGALVVRTGSVWTTIWAHFLIDATLGYFIKKGWVIHKMEEKSGV